jgi:hypothetical protein
MILSILLLAAGAQVPETPPSDAVRKSRSCGEACIIIQAKEAAKKTPPIAMKAMTQADANAVQALPLTIYYEEYFACTFEKFSHHPLSGTVSAASIDAMLDDAYVGCEDKRIANDRNYGAKMQSLSAIWRDDVARKMMTDIHRAMGVMALANYYFVANKNDSFNGYMRSVGL